MVIAEVTQIPSFTLGESMTAEQNAFLDENGFIRFGGFATPGEVAMLREEIETIEARWLEEGRVAAFGIPIKWGKGLDGRPMVNRFAFASQYSKRIQAFLKDERFERVRRICGEAYRLGEREKDGLVVNHYLNIEGSRYRQLGWHTDSLRDIFYLRLPNRFLNVGLYLDDSPKEVGGLRVIPGTHRQSVFGYLFRKAYFLDNRPDRREVCIEANAGDLTLHDGRLWHRVARATVTGEASRRRIMYMPFIKGKARPKTEDSRTPLYHHLQFLVG